jgi:ankyrin repeat protein
MVSVLVVKYRIDIQEYVAKLFPKTKHPDEENPDPRRSGSPPVTSKIPSKSRTPNEKDKIQLLCDFIKKGNIEAAEWLLTPEIPLDERNDDGWTALQLAAFHGHTGVTKKLLQHGASTNVSPSGGKGGRTALQAAAGAGHSEIVGLLLDKNADVNAEPTDNYGRTALQAAVEGGHLDIVNRLLEANANVHAKPAEKGGRTALQAAAGSGNLDIVNRFLEADAEVNAESDSGPTALQAAAGSGHLDVVDRLLEAGADVNAEPAFKG